MRRNWFGLVGLIALIAIPLWFLRDVIRDVLES